MQKATTLLPLNKKWFRSETQNNATIEAEAKLLTNTDLILYSHHHCFHKCQNMSHIVVGCLAITMFTGVFFHSTTHNTNWRIAFYYSAFFNYSADQLMANNLNIGHAVFVYYFVIILIFLLLLYIFFHYPFFLVLNHLW